MTVNFFLCGGRSENLPGVSRTAVVPSWASFITVGREAAATALTPRRVGEDSRGEEKHGDQTFGEHG